MKPFSVHGWKDRGKNWINNSLQLVKKNQRGISLVELIIVIAIIVVVTSGALVGVRVLNSGDASKASKLISSELTTMRENTLSVAGPWTMEIVNNNGTYYIMTYQNGSLVSKDKLGSRIELAYHEDGVGEFNSIAKNEKIILAFKQASGAVERIDKVSVSSEDELMSAYVDEEGSTSPNTLMIDATSQYFIFGVKGNNKSNQTEVNLAYETGRIIVGDLNALTDTGGTAADETESE